MDNIELKDRETKIKREIRKLFLKPKKYNYRGYR